MTRSERSLKEAKAKKKAQKRKARRRKRVIVLLSEIIIFVFLSLGVYEVMKGDGSLPDWFGKEDIQINEGVEQEGYTTIALFGGDSREGQLEAGTHADTIIIASIHNSTKEVKLVSVYRDTLMESMDGEVKKANNAYFKGGPKEAINTLNRNLDLDIEHYVTVDFKALVDVIDLLEGIEIDVTQQEADAINDYIVETAMVADKEAKMMSGGLQTLDGVQAVTYARIRKNVGGDYARTERQRLVLQKVMEKVKQTDLSTLTEIATKVFPQVSTSFTLPEMLKLASGVLQYKLGDTSGFPFELTDGRVKGVGSVVIPLGVAENVEELHMFLYPEDEYVVSQTVKDIAREIETVSGYTREDYKPESSEVSTDE